VARRVTVGCSRSSSERGDWKERERARRLGRRTCRNQPQGDATCGRPLSSTRPDSSARTGHSVSAWLGKPGMTAGVSAAALSPRSGGLQPRPRRDRGPRARDQLWEWRRPGRRRPGRAADRRPEPGSVVAQPRRSPTGRIDVRWWMALLGSGVGGTVAALPRPSGSVARRHPLGMTSAIEPVATVLAVARRRVVRVSERSPPSSARSPKAGHAQYSGAPSVA
jgi:hypothetical protein